MVMPYILERVFEQVCLKGISKKDTTYVQCISALDTLGYKP